MIIKDHSKFIEFDKVNAIEVVQRNDMKYTLAFYLEGGIVCAGEYSEEEFANKVLEEILKNKVNSPNIAYQIPLENKTKEEIWKEIVSEGRK